ncbi:MAG: hypothetical protein VX112_01480 [Pseudomonadota bacterium]|nr:hypothetical protein [Pseudomonadota bacterium]
MRKIDSQLANIIFKSCVGAVYCFVLLFFSLFCYQYLHIEWFFLKMLIVFIPVLATSTWLSPFIVIWIGLWLDLQFGAIVGISAFAFWWGHKAITTIQNNNRLDLANISIELFILCSYFAYAAVL